MVQVCTPVCQRHFAFALSSGARTPENIRTQIQTQTHTHTGTRTAISTHMIGIPVLKSKRSDLNTGFLLAHTHGRLALTHVSTLNQLKRIALPCRTRAQYAFDHAAVRILFIASIVCSGENEVPCEMPNCPKCDKPVYFAERKTSLGKDWHRSCLRCEKCNKTLTPGSHSEHEGKPYCNRPCYSTMYGPGGFGRGGTESYVYKK